MTFDGRSIRICMNRAINLPLKRHANTRNRSAHARLYRLISAVVPVKLTHTGGIPPARQTYTNFDFGLGMRLPGLEVMCLTLRNDWAPALMLS